MAFVPVPELMFPPADTAHVYAVMADSVEYATPLTPIQTEAEPVIVGTG